MDKPEKLNRPKLDDFNRPIDGLQVTRLDTVNAIDQDLKVEKTPYANPTQISKGDFTSTLGGIFTLKDSTGGTTILTYDPDTGVVTIAGGVTAQQTLNLGTITSSTFTGTTTNIGTMALGLVNAGTLNNIILGTPSINGGTMGTAFINSPTVSGGTLTNSSYLGTAIFTTTVGSAALATSGQFALQTFAGTPILVANIGGTTAYFVSAGTL